jgi:hypothetical protein
MPAAVATSRSEAVGWAGHDDAVGWAMMIWAARRRPSCRFSGRDRPSAPRRMFVCGPSAVERRIARTSRRPSRRSPRPGPTSADVQRDPSPHYHWPHRHDPVHRGAMGLWYLTRYTDVRAVPNDDRFLRAGIRDFWLELVGPGPLGGHRARRPALPGRTRSQQGCGAWSAERSPRTRSGRSSRGSSRSSMTSSSR